MINKFLSYTLIFLLFYLSAFAQEISSMVYRSNVVIPHDYEVNGFTVGGLSAITFNVKDSLYYLVADKPPARVFKASITDKALPEIRFEKALVLRPQLLSKSELEGIAYNRETNHFYVADEQKDGTRIIELNSEAEFLRLVEPVNQSFIPLSDYNSGIEGLTISDDLKYLFYAFERPTSDCSDESLVSITRKLLTKQGSYQTYFYKLHPVAGDILKTNGISDILFLSDSTILVMERAYISGQGNEVRLYQTLLNEPIPQDNSVSCDDKSMKPLASKLLFDFATVADFEIDNAEGMTFNADKSRLFIVTDNNFSKKQITQIITLDVIWR